MASHPEQDGGGSTADDLKARFKEALERKQGNDRGVEPKRGKQKGHVEAHGPAGGQRLYRRKAGSS